MAEKRYAIVRVDKLKFCPSDIEGIDDKLVCSKTKDGESKVCICRYGDTKEQLIRKVAQVLIWKADEIRALKAYKLSREEKKVLDKEYFDLARRIVEFLGVE